ncbi:MAG TPA: ribosome small subunit-dependent GTPase A [Tepidisphaeraceae bacterium]
MKGRNKSSYSADLTNDFLSGAFDEDRVEENEKFSDRSKHAQHHKTIKTQAARDANSTVEVDAMPLGEVIQVHSLFLEVLSGGVVYRCTQRKTLAKVSDTQIVVGDFVKFALAPERNDVVANEGAIARIEPRRTILMRADSFKAIEVHPIVANADQMLIVAALHLPEVKWGLVDRMVIAARSGGLAPVICLNKIDTAASEQDLADAAAVLAHYETLGVPTLRTSAPTGQGLDALRDVLRDKTSVLAGHSGVGKSSLVRVVEPSIDLAALRVGAISQVHSKGMHTTTSARKFPLSFGGHVIDTPGVKLFGLWNTPADGLIAHYPDVEAGTAPTWRAESYERILKSLT